MGVIGWVAGLLPTPDLNMTADQEAAVETALRDADDFLEERLAACGWRDAEVSEATRALIQTAVHEANRLAQPVATTAHVVVAAFRWELPVVRHLTSDRVIFLDVLIALREAVSRMIPAELEIPVSPDLSGELMKHLTTLGPAQPDAIVAASWPTQSATRRRCSATTRTAWEREACCRASPRTPATPPELRRLMRERLRSPTGYPAGCCRRHSRAGGRSLSGGAWR